MRTDLVLVLLVATATPTMPQGAASIYQRPIEANAVITGSHLRDGSFQMQGVAAICGEMAKERSFTGEGAFIIEIADPPKGTITTITFGSKQLVGRTVVASSFRLSVGVTGAKIGQPPLYVLNTDPPGTKNIGSATLNKSNGVTTLKVSGVNDENERIELNVTCR
jgi:hypothetical protein